MRHIRICIICCIAFVIAILSSSLALAWKPNTHLSTAGAAIDDILQGSDSVRIDGKSYDVDPRVAEAIRAYPRHYFGGVVGPDAFPDIVFGQSRIHPDTPGKSYSDQWLQHIYNEGWAYYNRCTGEPTGPGTSCPDLPGEVLAFTYGFLTHAAGDMWGHTFVNEFARGVFPTLTDPSADRGIAIRHIIVEGYVGSHTPGQPPQLDAPVGFIHDTFITSPRARSLAGGSHFDAFLSLRSKLEVAKEKLETDSAFEVIGCIITAGITCITADLARTYVSNWIDDIDRGLVEWPKMSLDVANELFFRDDPDHVNRAINRVDEFRRDYLQSMLGLPDAIGEFETNVDDVLTWARDEFKPVKDALDALNPLDDLAKWLIKEAFGIDLHEWMDYITSPQAHINRQGSPVGLAQDTSQRLDALMGITDGIANPDAEFNTDNFAAAKNTVVLSKLLLLDSKELNVLLHDHHVGAIYGRPGFPDNAMLGFIRTLDGDHQWQDQAVALAIPGGRSYGINRGMPLWRDCLARDRVFRALFEDWQNEENEQNFPGGFDDCAQISSGLPPVELNLTPEQEQLSEPICFGRIFTAELINHKQDVQSFALYLRVTDSFGDIVEHSVDQGILDVFETQTYSMTVPGNGCQGTYTLAGYLFERMWSLDVNDQEANPPIRPTKLLPARVNSPQIRSIVIKDPKLCPVCRACSENRPDQQSTPIVPGGSQLPCPPTPPVCTACDNPFPIRRLLDADHDGILDGSLRGQPGDNCPTVYNPDQADRNVNGTGDVCEFLELRPVDKGDIASLLEQLDSARYAEIMLQLFSEPDFPEPLGPWCLVGLTCPEVMDELQPAVRSFTRSFNAGLVSPGVYSSAMREIVRGPSIRTDTAEVLSVSLDGSRSAMVFAIQATANDKMTIRLPRVLLDAKINGEIADLVILVNGSIRHSTETLSANYRVLEIPLHAGDSEVSIRGTQLGPKLDEQAPTLSNEAMRALAFVASLIAAMIGFFTIRYLRKRGRLAAARAAHESTDTSSANHAGTGR